MPHALPDALVKHSRKLATATALLLWQKCLEFHGKKNLSQY